MPEVEIDIFIAVISTSCIILMLISAFAFFLVRNQNRIKEKEIELLNSVLQAQENEQERIARDLHDQIGPLLSIVKSQINSVDKSSLSALDNKIMIEVGEQLGGTIKEVRSVAHNLIPRTFSEYGFLKSLEYYIIRIREFNNIEIDFTFPEWQKNLSKNFEISLYRIIQELIHNSLKHSKGTKIKLKLFVSSDHLYIDYSDNGIGIDVDSYNKKGIGLYNIGTRVDYLGGKYELVTKQNEGCQYKFKFNLNKLYGK